MRFNASIEAALSTARLSTYRVIARDDEHAWELYRWNLDLVAAFTPLISDLEIALRNTVHLRLSEHFGRSDWWASNSLYLDDATASMLATAVGRQRKSLTKGSVNTGKVLADLSFGAWVHLLGRGGHSSLGRAVDYERHLWRPALRLGFATGRVAESGRVRRPTRDVVHVRAAVVHRLRNRSAHQEPIFSGIVLPGTKQRLALEQVRLWAIELLGWMCPDLAELHVTQTAVPELLASRPEM